MYESRHPQPDEVDQLLRNAELRDELERYFDESISRVNIQHATLAAENEFLACMLAWEQGPVLYVYTADRFVEVSFARQRSSALRSN